MTSNSSKSIPFIVLAIVAGFMAVDTFTPYHITDQMIQLATVILTPLGVGGLVNKAWDTYKAVKENKPPTNEEIAQLAQQMKTIVSAIKE